MDRFGADSDLAETYMIKSGLYDSIDPLVLVSGVSQFLSTESTSYVAKTRGFLTIDQKSTTEAKEVGRKLTKTQDIDFMPMIDSRPTYIDGQPVIYLTFDDGPSRYTPNFVELLGRYNARATFFVLGSQVDRWPEIAAQVKDAGHYLANHTYTHPRLTYYGQTFFNNQVMSTYNAIQRVTNGQDNDRGKPLCLRPTYGAYNYLTEAYASALGYELALWDVDPQDWRLPGVWQISSHVINTVTPGAIVLLHDGGGYRDQTLAALEMILQSLGEQGYRFESLCQ